MPGTSPRLRPERLTGLSLGTAAGPSAGSDDRRPPEADEVVVARRSMVVAAGTAVSRLTGFGRVATTAAVLGPGYLGNTYQATNTIPNYAYELVAGSLFVPLLVPHLVRHVDRGDRNAEEATAGHFLGVALFVSLLVGIVVVAAGPLLLGALTIGVDDPATASAQRRAGWLLLVLVMPQVSLYSVAAVGSAVMNSHNRFALAAAAPALENLGIVVTLVVFGSRFGHGTSLLTVGTGQLLLLGIGTTAAVGFHAGVQWYGAHRAGVTLVPRLRLRRQPLGGMVGLSIPSLGYAGVSTVLAFSWLVVANRVAGGVVAFQMAFQLFELPVAMAARPVVSAALPQLARRHADRDLRGFHVEMTTAARLIIFLTVPAALALTILAAPLAHLLCYGGMATPRGMTMVAACLATLGPGVAGYAALTLTTQAAYAAGDARSALRSMCWGAVASLALMAAILIWAHGVAVMLLLGVAVSTGFVLSAAHLGLHLGITDTHVAPGGGIYPAARRAVRGSAVMLPTAYLIGSAALHVTSRVAQLSAVVCASVIGAGVFLIVERLCRSPELRLLQAVVARRAG